MFPFPQHIPSWCAIYSLCPCWCYADVTSSSSRLVMWTCQQEEKKSLKRVVVCFSNRSSFYCSLETYVTYFSSPSSLHSHLFNLFSSPSSRHPLLFIPFFIYLTTSIYCAIQNLIYPLVCIIMVHLSYRFVFDEYMTKKTTIWCMHRLVHV